MFRQRARTEQGRLQNRLEPVCCFSSARRLRFQALDSVMAPHEHERRNLASVPDEQVREYLLSGNLSEMPQGLIKPEVRDSWQRCLDANLDPKSVPDIPPIARAELKELRE